MDFFVGGGGGGEEIAVQSTVACSEAKDGGLFH